VRAQFSQVKLIANTVNRYFSAANDQGFEQAAGRYILALNPDTVVQGSTLKQLVQQMDADPQIGAATTTMFFPSGKLQRNGSHFVTFGFLLFEYTLLARIYPVRKAAYRDWLWYAEWDRRTAREIDILPGSCIIAAKETWRAAGGF